LLQFFTRPFVDGDSVLVQAPGGMTVSGVVEKTTIMRTTMRTDDDVVVTIPNKVCGFKHVVFAASIVVARGVHSGTLRQWYIGQVPLNRQHCALQLQTAHSCSALADAMCLVLLLQTVADMIVYNRSAEVRRSALATANRQSENIKLRLKLPYAAEGKLRELQELVKSSLEPPRRISSSGGGGTDASSSLDEASSSTGTFTTTTTGSSSSSNGSSGPVSPSASPSPAAAVPQSAAASRRPSSAFGDAFRSLAKPKVPARTASTKPSHPVVPDSVEVVVSRFTDAGLELLVKGKLRVEPTDSMVQALLLDLSRKVRELGATMTSV
jgi:hypothetical protein